MWHGEEIDEINLMNFDRLHPCMCQMDDSNEVWNWKIVNKGTTTCDDELVNDEDQLLMIVYANASIYIRHQLEMC